MKLVLVPAEKFVSKNKAVFVILSESEKAFGIPAYANSPIHEIKEILKAQSKKILNDSVEILQTPTATFLIGQIPNKKGLDRADKIRLGAARILDILKSRSIEEAAICMQSAEAEDLQAILEGLRLSEYDFNKYKSEKKTSKLNTISLLIAQKSLKKMTDIFNETEIVTENINQCRDLVNEPGSHLLPQDLLEVARKASKAFGLTIAVRDVNNLRKEGFHGLWTVGKGSDHPPVMITLSYQPAKAKKSKPAHLCLVGKGITFDTGGISIKPSAGMAEMKSDMAGAATALRAICTIAALKLPIQVTTILCVAENRPGNMAVLPGDIFTAKNGKTVMVDNTDAEGRLVLSDGLAEAGIRNATHIIDLATLTGAIIRAIGPSIAGLFSNDKSFAHRIKESGAKVSEKLWELPLENEYREYLEDPVADLKNVGKSEAGAITAALFLEEFVPPKTAWAHLDIAGTAFTGSTWKYFKPGSTGWGVKTLVEVARSLA